MASDLVQGIGDIGGAVNDLFDAFGDTKSATAYSTAANIANQNAAITLRSTQIQEAQTQRQILQTTGAETAQTAGAGMTNSGSALDLARSSIQQGALQKQMVQNQGEITTQGFTQQAAAYEGQKQAADMAAAGKTGGGIGGLVGGALSIFGL